MKHTKNDCLINFVLDSSSSMSSQRAGTVEGVQALLDEQLALPGKTRLSLTLFNTEFEVRYVAKNAAKLPRFGEGTNPYQPSGMTALLDAVGSSIQGTEAWLAAHPDFKGRVMCVILTDGQENASKLWHINRTGQAVNPGLDFGTIPRSRSVLYQPTSFFPQPAPQVFSPEYDLGALIERKQADGWEFVFLGAGGSAWLEQTFGSYVPKGAIVRTVASDRGSRRTYAGVSSAMTRSRVSGASFSVAQEAVLDPSDG